jgi:hypothetical protein
MIEPQFEETPRHEPDFGLPPEAAAADVRASREPTLVLDLTDLPKVAAPMAVDAFVPSIDAPVGTTPPPALPAAPVAAPAMDTPEPVETPPVGPEAAKAMTDDQQAAPEPLAIRRPAPPPRPLPAAARAKAQTPPERPAPAIPATRPAPVSIAPLKSTAPRASSEGSKAPTNFRPLLPKTDGTARPVRPQQRRPFTEITVPFEGPAVLPEAAVDRPAAAQAAIEPAAMPSIVAAAEIETAPPTRQPGPASKPAPASKAAQAPAPAPAATPALAEPVEPIALEEKPAIVEPAIAQPPAPNEAELDNAAAAAIEQGSGAQAADRSSQTRAVKPLPKMPPPRLTPDTVEAIFAEAFARGSAEPPERKS